MNGKLYIKKFIRDDGETLSFDADEIYLSENNTLLVRSDPATTAVEFTEEDGGEMIRQRGATYSQPVSGLIVPKSTEYWALCVRLSRFFILNHTYKIVYIKRDGSMFSMNRAWINAGLQIVPVPYENYSTWTIEFRIGDNFWTEYAEDGQGKEIYSNTVELPLLTAGTGGEVWSDATQQTLSGLGNYFTIDGTSTSASINKLEMRGDANQDGTPTPSSPITIDVVTGEQTVNVTGKNLLDVSSLSQAAINVGQVVENGLLSDTSPTDDRRYWGYANCNWTIILSPGVYTLSETFTKRCTNASIGALRIYTSSGTLLVHNYDITDKDHVTNTFTLTETTSIGIIIKIADGECYVQLEKGANATAYEPYRGQSYEINLGKNIWSSSMEVGGISANGTNLSNDKRVRSTTKVVVRPGTTYTLSATPRDSGKVINVAVQGWASDGTFISQITGADWQTLPLTFTTPANCYKVTLNGRYSDDTVFGTVGESTDAFQNIQLEAGANATEYAQYFPPVELCKIGTYQDYIYKSGDDWYVHKEINAFDLSMGTYVATTSSIRGLTNAPNIKYVPNNQTIGSAVTSGYRIRQGQGLGTAGAGWFAVDTNRVNFNTGGSTDPVGILYYARETAANILIENPALVAQLNALAGAQAYNGKTVYQTDSATMPAILSVELLQSVGGGEVWDNVGAVWEEGVGGVQTINVETTQTTYPVWTVTGPCSNPTLQNDTTDTLASFDGMIASGQTLTVNFADNTAYLDSAPVAKYVSGYVSLAPGENVIGFNSDGGSTQTSTIIWDNVIN